MSDLHDDYKAIRGDVGVWDYSDLVKVRVSGDGAMDALDRLASGNVRNLQEGSIRHTLMLDDSGRIVTDVLLFANFDEYVVTCPPARRDPMMKGLEMIAGGDVTVEDISDDYAVWVVEGPRAWKVARDLVGMEATGVRLLGFLECTIAEHEGLLVRTGSSGEYGYMFWVPPAARDLVVARIEDIHPAARMCGREVQDLLQLEVRAFNLERDIVDDETPLEAGLHWAIDFHKEAFVGREAILAERQAGPRKKLVAFELRGTGELSTGDAVYDGDAGVGYVANCGYSPTLDRSIGLAYLDADYAWVGLDLTVESEGDRRPLRTVSAPFFMTESNKAPMG